MVEALVVRLWLVFCLVACGCATAEPAPALPSPAPIPVPPEPPPPVPERPPAVPVGIALHLLGDPPGCAANAEPVPCGLTALYAGHAPERSDALALYAECGDVAGLDEGGVMDGGFRGSITLVPELPVGPHARLLHDVLSAQRSMAAFLAQVSARAPDPVRFRHTGIAWRFFRSVGRKTPSAMAGDWEIAVNVSGGLLTTAAGVEDTLMHEMFHNNDEGDWSRRQLGATVDAIVARCGTDTACLEPYSPGTTKVKGGTWYAFQPDNGDPAHEYAAELSLRYLRETRAALQGAPPPAPFRCRTPENRAAWDAYVATFMGGLDLSAPCVAGG